jgi:hypothetical protein
MPSGTIVALGFMRLFTLGHVHKLIPKKVRP